MTEISYQGIIHVPIVKINSRVIEWSGLPIRLKKRKRKI